MKKYISRMRKQLQEGGGPNGGLFYKWAGELKDEDIKIITGEEGDMMEKGQNKMITYYEKNLIK